MKKKESNIKDMFIGLILFLTVVVFWYLSWRYIDRNIISETTTISNEESRGLFGDKFGAVNALFSGLAFAGIIFTIFLQKRELTLQREELEETRNELKGQKLELEKANWHTAIQQFDTKFFQLLNLQNQIKIGIHVDKATNTYFNMENKSGNLFFQQLSLLIAKRFYEDEFPEVFGIEKNEAKMITIYKKSYHQYKAILGHYFRNLYHLVKEVDESKILLEEEKIKYVKIVRAQLSQYEIVLLAYNGLSKYGKSFYPLMSKYELLKNIDFELLTPRDYIIKVVTPAILISRYPYLQKVYDEQLDN